jgi:2-amino-4-hydroxy-6-hydroxymethyldihydropteridine diphosphokinase
LKERAYVGLGANEGALAETLDAAVEALRNTPDIELVSVSPRYRSEPIEAEGGDFINAVAALDTTLEPYDLLLTLLDLELRLGRRRRGPDAQLKAARKLDLDLLLFGDLQMMATPLTLPHPRLHQRAFVLRPLLDLAPDIEIPALGPARDWLEKVAHQRIERVERVDPDTPPAV